MKWRKPEKDVLTWNYARSPRGILCKYFSLQIIALQVLVYRRCKCLMLRHLYGDVSGGTAMTCAVS